MLTQFVIRLPICLCSVLRFVCSLRIKIVTLSVSSCRPKKVSDHRYTNWFCISKYLYETKVTQEYMGLRQRMWPRGLRRGSAAARLLRLWVRIPPGVWMFVCCECCVSSGRGLCDELITRPEKSYRLCCVVVCDLEISRMRKGWHTRRLSHQNKQTNKQTKTEDVIEEWRQVHNEKGYFLAFLYTERNGIGSVIMSQP